MATKLLNSVKRECLSTFACGKGKGEQIIIVSLEPGDMLKFRPKGFKTSFEISLHACFNLAQIMFIESEYKRKTEEYNTRKKAGYKAKKPRKPFAPFSRIYYKALNKD